MKIDTRDAFEQLVRRLVPAWPWTPASTTEDDNGAVLWIMEAEEFIGATEIRLTIIWHVSPGAGPVPDGYAVVLNVEDAEFTGTHATLAAALAEMQAEAAAWIPVLRWALAACRLDMDGGARGSS